MMLSQNFLNWKQAQYKVNLCSKKIRKREKGKAQKMKKNIKKKVTFSSKNLKLFISARARAKKSQNMVLVKRTACCHVANAFLSRSELIWPIFRRKISKMSKKKTFLANAPGVNGLNKFWSKCFQLEITVEVACIADKTKPRYTPRLSFVGNPG